MIIRPQMIESQSILLEESGQNAIVAWNGNEEIIILSTDMKSSQSALVLELIPLPSNPTEIEEGNLQSFTKLANILNQKIKHKEQKSLTKSLQTTQPPGVEITFQKKIGAHDVTIVKVNSLDDFSSWVKDFLENKGLENIEPSPAFSNTLSNYLNRNVSHFVFDVIETNESLQTLNPLVYRFKSDYLYYPLEITATSDVGWSSSNVNLFLIAKGRMNPTVVSEIGFSSAGIGLSSEAIQLTKKELKEISPKLENLFRSGAFVTNVRYSGPLNALNRDLRIYPSDIISSPTDEINFGSVYIVGIIILAVLLVVIYKKINRKRTSSSLPNPPLTSFSESSAQKGILNQLKVYWQNRRFRLVFAGLILLFFAGFIGGKIWWLGIERSAYKSLIENNIPQQMDESLKNLFQNSPVPTKIPVPAGEKMTLKQVEKLSPQETKKLTVSEKNYNIWITDNEKKTQKQVTFEGQVGDDQYSSVVVTNPVLSPDQQKIAYFVMDGGGMGGSQQRKISSKRGIYVFNIVTNQKTLVEEIPDFTEGIFCCIDVFWNKDSSIVYFLGWGGPLSALKKKYDLNTKTFTKLELSLPPEVSEPTQNSFSPQTGNLAYAAMGSNTNQSFVGVTNLSGNYNKILAKGWYPQYQFPKISPNGKSVVYFEGQEKSSNLGVLYLYDLESDKKVWFGFTDLIGSAHFLNDQYFVLDRFGTTTENIEAGPFIIDLQNKQYAKKTPVAPSAFQDLLAQKCQNAPKLDPYLKSININELPVRFEPWIVSAYLDKQIANCDEGESVNTGFVILKFGELSLYDKYSKERGRGGAPLIGLVGETIEKDSNVEFTAYLQGGDGSTIVGEAPVIVRGEKKLTLQNGEVVYINVSKTAIEGNDPRLIAVLDNYAGQSDAYENKKQINRWGYEEAIVKRFFSDLSNLESPEKEALEQVKKTLAGISAK